MFMRNILRLALSALFIAHFTMAASQCKTYNTFGLQAACGIGFELFVGLGQEQAESDSENQDQKNTLGDCHFCQLSTGLATMERAQEPITLDEGKAQATLAFDVQSICSRRLSNHDARAPPIV